MAVLVITGGSELDEQVVTRLVSQGDEVRVLEPTSQRREHWVRSGAFLASGEADDPDLVERAAQNVRTIVVLTERVSSRVIATVLEAGPKAGVDRLVCCAPTIPESVKTAVRSSSIDHVLLESGRPGLLRRRSPTMEFLAEAVDAADDLAGEPRLELDLSQPDQAEHLGL